LLDQQIRRLEKDFVEQGGLRERMTRAVSDAYARFSSLVTERRGIAREQIDALNGDLLEGEAAIAAHLADVLGSLEDAIELAGGVAAQVPATAGTNTEEQQPMALATRTRNAADPPAETPKDPPAETPESEPKPSALEVECPVAEGG
jgi:ClpP class serine protease